MKNTIPFLFATTAIFITPFISTCQVSFSDSGNLFLTTDVFSSHPCGVTDMNGDGLDDVIRLHNGNDLYIEYQNSNGTFTEFHFGEIDTDSGWGNNDAWGMCIGDVDRNGRCDILAGGAYDELKIVLAGSGDTDYSVTQLDAINGIFLQGVNFFDMDYDGDLDVFACHDDGPSQILINDGSGNFTEDDGTVFNTALYNGDEQNAGNYGSVWSDVNNDLKADLYIAKCRQGVTDPSDVRRINQLWLYTPDGYSEVGEESSTNSGWQSWSADFADIDNDGDMDLFVGNHDHANQLFENLGNNLFMDISDVSGIEDVFSSIVIQSIFRDFDNDGWIDLLISGGNEYVIARNNGDMTFTALDAVFGNYGLNSFACGDLNNDGRVDVYATEGGYGSFNNNTADALFLNSTENSNHYLELDLQETVSPPNGVGAIVVIETASGTQMREVRSGESYGIQNSLNLHFGLGSETTVDHVDVYWPSGIHDDAGPVQADQLITLVEGASPALVENSNPTPVRVVPNPATQSARIVLDQLESRTLRLFNTQGTLVFTDHPDPTRSYFIERGNLPGGLYRFTLTGNSGQVVSGEIIFE